MAIEEVEILLVEDRATDAELTIRALKGQHLANKLVWVKDGVEALDFLFQRGPYASRSGAPPPRLVLLDLGLPKVSGLEVLEAMKADERMRTIPVVVLTSSREDRDLVDSYRLGVNSFVSKPVEFDRFVETVGRLGLYWLLVNQTPPL
jgi:CheY-like chemotaxis protein